MSGSAGNVNAQLTANIAQFTAAMAAAAASVQQFTTASQNAANQAAASMATAAASINASANQVTGAFNNVSPAIGKTTTQLNTLGLRANFVGRELHAIVDETITGRWTQFSGTIANVVGTMAQANPILTAQIGIVAALAAGVAVLAYQWAATATAINHAEGEMLIVGQHGAGAVNAIKNSLADSSKTWDMWGSDARKVEIAIRSLGGPSAQYSQQIKDIAAAHATLMGGDVVKYTEEIAKKFNEGAEGALTWADSIHLLDGQTASNGSTLHTYVDDLIKAGQQTQAMQIIVDAANTRFVKAAKDRVSASQEMRRQALVSGEGTGLAFTPEIASPQPLPDQKVADPRAAEDSATVDKINEALRRRTQYTQELAAAQTALMRAQESGDAPAIIAANEAITAVEQKLTQTHTVSEQQQHEATLGRLQQDLAAQRDFADRRIPILKSIATEESKFYGESSAQARTAQNQIAEGQRAASDAALRLKLAELQGQEVAVRNSVGAQIAIEDQKLAVLRAYGKQGTIEYQEELNRRTALTVTAGNRSTTMDIEALRAKQAAHAGDYQFQLNIENQILGMLKDHYGQASIEYQKELIHREELQVAAAKQESAIARDVANTQREVSRSQQRMAEQLFKSQSHGGTFSLLELLGGTDGTAQFKDQLAQITEAHKQAIDAIKEQQAEAVDPLQMQKALDTEIRENQSFAEQMQRVQLQAADSTRKAWESVGNGIASSIANSLSGMLTGTRTVAQGIGSILQSLMTKVLDYSLKMAARWLIDRALELAGTSSTEAAKTAATAAGTATRTGLTQAETAAENSSFILRALRWIASELGMTEATTAGTAARATEQAAAAAETEVTAATVNVGQVESYAAIAAAGAAASVAATPFIGPELAVAAAASTYAALQPYAAIAALDVGAWNVPQDMVAQIHKDEMVVPATFAEGVRQRGGFGGESSSGVVVNHSPSISASGGGVTANQIESMLSLSRKDMFSYLNSITRNGGLRLPGRGLA